MTANPPWRAARRVSRWAALAVLGMLCAACGGGAQTQDAVSADPGAGAQEDVVWSPGTPGAPSPERVLLPRLEIDAALDPLALDRKRVLIPPAYGRAGWYADGPEPGEPGRAVLAGHLDSKTGPDVFARLGRARAGDQVVVRLEGGRQVTYRVQRVKTFPQSEFPTDAVYGGPGKTSEIRLITCAGPYDRARGRYLENVVVFAELVP
jgi:LPXTG-site transpeptidase (sortase) family protein